MSEIEANGITAWIQVNESRLECYSASSIDTGTGDAPVVDCWVASEAGEKFAVALSTPRKTLVDDYVAFLEIDGHRLSDRIISREDKRDDTWWTGAKEGNIRRPFIFASPNVTDDDTLLDSLDNAHNSRIGEIKVEIYRITGLHDIVAPTVKQHTLPPVQTVHETSVKASRPLHQISLGEGVPEIYGSNIRYAYHGRHERLVTFVFRYRPLETLVENGIAGAPSNSAGKYDMSRLGSVTHRSPVASSASMSRPIDAVPQLVKPAKGQLQTLPQPHSTQHKPSSLADVPRIKREIGTESKATVQGIKTEVQSTNDLDDEERNLMEQLESVRKRKRDAQQDSQSETPAKVVKRVTLVPGGSSTSGDAIDLT